MKTRHRPIVVVTGASAGVGRAAVRAFAQAGANLGLIARGHEGLDAAKHEVEALGGTALAIPTDVADPQQVEAAADAVERGLGPIEVWVNNAMVSVLSPMTKLTPEEFRRVTEVTYLGYVWGTMAALRRMLARDHGTIVQVGSALAYRSIPLQSAYCGAKHAIVGFTESLRSELIHDNSHIQITMVHLPGINTPQFDWIRNKMPRKSNPLGAVFQPEVAARAILWAAQHRRREVFVGGPTVKAVIGEKVAPDLMDRYLASTAFDGQQREEPEANGRPDNLFQPLPHDHGAHGPFDQAAKNHSAQLWFTTHRRAFAWVIAALVVVGISGLAGVLP